jgi:hypothetical protein
MSPTPDPMDLPLTLRRQLLGGAGGLLAGAMLAPALGLAATPTAAAAATAPGPVDDWMNDPQKRLENFLRTTGDLSGRVSPQWWRGVYMGVVPGHQPTILFRLEGCEMKRLVRRGPRECEIQYRLFTSFNDPVTNEPLSGKRWRNPFTSQEVIVEPNIGSSDTVVRLTDRGITETTIKTGFEGVIHLVWAAQENTVLMAGNKDRPANTPAPTGEYATHWLDRRAAAQFDAPRLEMSFNSTFMMGFRKFLGMPADQGLSVWHASGIKAKSVEALPENYLQELWKHRPELRDWVRAG